VGKIPGVGWENEQDLAGILYANLQGRFRRLPLLASFSDLSLSFSGQWTLLSMEQLLDQS
jgi:hypothetical protein